MRNRNPKMHEIVRNMARYVAASGYDVEHADGRDGLDEFYCIFDESGEPVFTLRYDEHDKFKRELIKLRVEVDKITPLVDDHTLMLAAAKPYIDCI